MNKKQIITYLRQQQQECLEKVEDRRKGYYSDMTNTKMIEAFHRSEAELETINNILNKII